MRVDASSKKLEIIMLIHAPQLQIGAQEREEVLTIIIVNASLTSQESCSFYLRVLHWILSLFLIEFFEYGRRSF